MLPREPQLLPALACICVGVYGIDRITLERMYDASHNNASPSGAPSVFDVTLAGIELPGGSQVSAAAPFYVAARDWLRRQLIGTEVTFAPVTHRVGHIYAAPSVDASDPAADDMMVNGQLVRQGFAVARSFPTPPNGVVANPKSAGERRKAWFRSLEEQAREKGVGYHGIGRLSDAVRVVKPFPEPDHPYQSLLVHHLQSADAVKFTVESVVSPFLLTCVHSRSFQEVQIRICGIAASRIESYFQQARWAMIRELLHREVVFTFHGFDETTQTFWARIVSHHGDVVSSVLERGVMTFDDRCSALPTSYVESLLRSQAKAQSQKIAIWSSASTSSSALGNSSVRPSCLPPRPTLQSVTGVVQAVFDDSSFELVVPCDSESEIGGGMAKTQVYVISISHLQAPLSAVSGSSGGAQSEKRVKYVDAGAVVTYSARSFFGREALRTLLIGRTVSVSGATSSIQQRPTITAVDIVVQPSCHHYAAASPAPAVSVDVVKHLLSHYPQWYSISLGTSSFPLVAALTKCCLCISCYKH
jgi:endonuclease YncB( thermonuclease family)